MAAKKDYITRLRFPLAVGVVFIHTVGRVPSWERASDISMLELVQWLCSSALPSIAVPCFFVISGFLFFQGYRAEEGVRFFQKKWRSRLLTLLVPYVLWNLIKFALLWAQAGWSAGAEVWREVGGLGLLWGSRDIGSDYINWWGLHIGHLTAPLNVPLWFVRDLMVCVALTPLLAWMLRVRHRAAVALGLMLAAHVLRSWPYIYGVAGSSLLLFSLGAVCALHGRDLWQVVRPYRLWSYCFFPLLVVAGLFCGMTWPDVALHPLYVATTFTGIAAYLNLAAERPWANTPPSPLTRYLASASFFIFVAHPATLAVAQKVVAPLATSSQQGVAIVGYLLTPLLAVALCLAGFAVLRQLPRLSAPLTGLWPARKHS